MTISEALKLVEKQGILLESAHGPIPNLAESVVGAPIRGGWWGHPRGQEIFAITRAMRQSRDILVCRLIAGKITYVHRRLWPALARLSKEVGLAKLAVVTETHTTSGRHEVTEIPFTEWLPEEARTEAKQLSLDEARHLLGSYKQYIGFRGSKRQSKQK